MKKLIFSTLLTPILLFSSTVTLEISNIEKQKGSLVIGLYDKAEVFPTVSEALDSHPCRQISTFDSHPCRQISTFYAIIFK